MATRPVKLTATSAGAKAFGIKFPTSLGPLLAETLKNSLKMLDGDEDYRPTDNKLIKLHELIYQQLVRSLDDHDELLIRMTQETQEDGPAGFKWLLNDIDPKSTVSAISTLMDILTTPLDGDIIESINKKISANNSLPKDLKLKDAILTVLIMVKLPTEYSTHKSVLVEKDALPTCKELVMSVTKSNQLAKVSGTPMIEHASFAFVRNQGSKVCYNCDDNSGNHFHNTCTKPKSDCDVCGKATGHMNKHCLTQNDRPIPDSIAVSTRNKILLNRQAFKQGTFKPGNQGGANFMVSDCFWDELEALEQAKHNY